MAKLALLTVLLVGCLAASSVSARVAVAVALLVAEASEQELVIPDMGDKDGADHEENSKMGLVDLLSAADHEKSPEMGWVDLLSAADHEKDPKMDLVDLLSAADHEKDPKMDLVDLMSAADHKKDPKMGWVDLLKAAGGLTKDKCGKECRKKCHKMHMNGICTPIVHKCVCF